MGKGPCHWQTYHTVHSAQPSGSQIWCLHLKIPELISSVHVWEPTTGLTLCAQWTMMPPVGGTINFVSHLGLVFTSRPQIWIGPW